MITLITVEIVITRQRTFITLLTLGSSTLDKIVISNKPTIRRVFGEEDDQCPKMFITKGFCSPDKVWSAKIGYTKSPELDHESRINKDINYIVFVRNKKFPWNQ